MSLAFSGLFIAQFSFAQELFPYVRDFRSVRSLGLGVPAVAMSSISLGDSAEDNPAWVGQEGKSKQKNLLRGVWFPGASFGANSTTRSLAKAYFSGQGSTQQKLENFLIASQNEQTPFGFFSLNPSVGFGPFQWNAFARVRVEGYVFQPVESAVSPVTTQGGVLNSDVAVDPLSTRVPLSLSGSNSPQMDVRATVERGTSLSFSVPYKNTGVFLGVTVRPTWRSDYWGNVELAEPLASAAATSLRAKFNETRGYPVDVGMLVRIPQLRSKPTIGLKIEDVTDTRFKGVSAGHQTMVQKSNISGGFSGWLLQNPGVSAQCGLAAHHLNDNRLEMSGKWGGGCEFHLVGQVEGDVVSNALAVARVGRNKDGWAYGLSFDLPFFILEMASSSARIDGPIGYTERLDRRYYLRLSVNAGQP
ncbi:hypothetical protein EBR21_08615 [bacterium]|nr:hypothetical protein [bacterium]